MGFVGTTLRASLAVAVLVSGLATAAPARAHNNTGALIGGLVAGALVGSAVTAASRPRYYYPPPPPPVYYPPAPVYAPGYCGAPPYPPCRTPVY